MRCEGFIKTFEISASSTAVRIEVVQRSASSGARRHSTQDRIRDQEPTFDCDSPNKMGSCIPVKVSQQDAEIIRWGRYVGMAWKCYWPVSDPEASGSDNPRNLAPGRIFSTCTLSWLCTPRAINPGSPEWETLVTTCLGMRFEKQA